jgi:hypothetical protein
MKPDKGVGWKLLRWEQQPISKRAQPDSAKASSKGLEERLRLRFRNKVGKGKKRPGCRNKVGKGKKRPGCRSKSKLSSLTE